MEPEPKTDHAPTRLIFQSIGKIAYVQVRACSFYFLGQMAINVVSVHNAYT